MPVVAVDVPVPTVDEQAASLVEVAAFALRLTPFNHDNLGSFLKARGFFLELCYSGLQTFAPFGCSVQPLLQG